MISCSWLSFSSLLSPLLIPTPVLPLSSLRDGVSPERPSPHLYLDSGGEVTDHHGLLLPADIPRGEHWLEWGYMRQRWENGP